MHQILQIVYEKKVSEMIRLKIRIDQFKLAQLKKPVTYVLPRRLTNRINRRISNKESMGMVPAQLPRGRTQLPRGSRVNAYNNSLLAPIADVDDSISMTSGATHVDGMENLHSRESIMKT